MPPKSLLPTLLAALLAAPLAPALAQEPPMSLQALRGGAIAADGIVDGDLVHLPTGRTLATWDFADPAAPRRLATSAPAPGPIVGLARHDDHLYAAWRSYAGGSGVTIWSLADPAAPERVADVAYTDADSPFAVGIAAAAGHLYVFDNNHGVFVSGLGDPARPVFAGTDVAATTQYTRIAVHDGLIHATGRNFFGFTVLDLYDVSAPTAPLRVGHHTMSASDSFSLVTEPQRAIGVGNRLTVYDLSDPTLLDPQGAIDIPPAIAGARAGAHHLYTFGYGAGLDIWNLADPANPVAAGHLDLRALGTRRSQRVDDGLLLLPSEIDLLQALDTSEPGAPRPVSASWLAGGVAPVDVAMHDGRLVLLQANYGLTLNDPVTLEPLARFEADLPEQLAQRSFEQMRVVGDTAWLAAWGFGLIAVDLSGGTPREIGRLPFPFAGVIEIEGDLAYLAKNTNGPLFAVADISDPGAPRLVWQAALPSPPHRLHVHAGHAYLAESGAHGSDAGGVRIWRLDDPAAPTHLGNLDDGCGGATDLAIDAEVDLLYLACDSGMQVIDIADPAAAAVVGRHPADGAQQSPRLAQRLDRAWYASADGVQQLDVADPTDPRPMGAPLSLGGQTAERLLALDDGRLVALGTLSGVHVFAGEDDGAATPLENGVPATGLGGGAGSARLFSIEVPEGAAALTVLAYGGSGDVRLRLRHGAPPDDTGDDAASDRPGNNEIVRIAGPAAGTWYLRLEADAAYGGVAVQARW